MGLIQLPDDSQTEDLIAAYFTEVAAPQLEPIPLWARAMHALAGRTEPTFKAWCAKRGLVAPEFDHVVDRRCKTAAWGDLDQLVADTKAGRYPAPPHQ